MAGVSDGCTAVGALVSPAGPDTDDTGGFAAVGVLRAVSDDAALALDVGVAGVALAVALALFAVCFSVVVADADAAPLDPAAAPSGTDPELGLAVEGGADAGSDSEAVAAAGGVACAAPGAPACAAFALSCA